MRVRVAEHIMEYKFKRVGWFKSNVSCRVVVLLNAEIYKKAKIAKMFEYNKPDTRAHRKAEFYGVY